MEDVESFTYLGSIINKQGGVEEDVKTRIQKARQAFIGLRHVWSSKVFTEKTKIRLFNSNVKSVLLYGSETWRNTKATVQRIQSFVICQQMPTQNCWSTLAEHYKQCRPL